MIAEFVPAQSGNRLEVLKCSSSQRSRYFGSISETARPIQHFNKVEHDTMTISLKKTGFESFQVSATFKWSPMGRGNLTNTFDELPEVVLYIGLTDRTGGF